MIALRHTRLPPDFKPAGCSRGRDSDGGRWTGSRHRVCKRRGSPRLTSDRSRPRNGECGWLLARAGRASFASCSQESLLLGIGGGACGLLLALWTSDVLPSFFPAEQASLLDTSVDTGTVAFIAIISIASSLLFGLAPALQASDSTALSLRAGSGRGSDGRGSARLRRLLVGAQVAAAVVLLVSSGLLVKSLANALAADTGFGTREGVVATVELPPTLEESQGLQYYAAVLEQVRGMPGVRGAAFVRTLPLSRASRRGFQSTVTSGSPAKTWSLVINVVSSGCSRPCRSRSARDGRSTRDQRERRTDRHRQRPDGQPFLCRERARPADHGLQAVGQWDRRGPVPQVLTMQEPPVATVYYPLEQEYRPRMTLAARVDGPARVWSTRSSGRCPAVNPRIPVYRSMLLSAHLDESVAADRLTASLVALCGGMALLLATIGVCGVIAYAVVRRSREIGIRVALGARPPDVVRLILGEGVRVIGGGVGFGLVATALTARALGSLMPLYGVGPTDPLTYATVPALLVGVALLAAMAPPAGRCVDQVNAATGVGARWTAADIRDQRSGIREPGKARHGPTGNPWILILILKLTVSLLQFPQHEALQVIRLRARHQHRVVAPLHSFLDNDHVGVGIHCRCSQYIGEHRPRFVVRTAAGNQESGWLERLERPQVDFLVSRQRFRHGRLVLGKRRRVEHDGVEPFASTFEFAELVEHIHRAGLHVGYVSRGVRDDAGDGVLRNVDGNHLVADARQGQREAAVVAERVERATTRVRSCGHAVLTLVEEQTGFLTMIWISPGRRQPLADFDDVGHRSVLHHHDLLQALEQPDAWVIAGQDAGRLEAVDEQRDEVRKQAIDAAWSTR